MEGGKGSYPPSSWVETMFHRLVASEASFHNLKTNKNNSTLQANWQNLSEG